MTAHGLEVAAAGGQHLGGIDHRAAAERDDDFGGLARGAEDAAGFDEIGAVRIGLDIVDDGDRLACGLCQARGELLEDRLIIGDERLAALADQAGDFIEGARRRSGS